MFRSRNNLSAATVEQALDRVRALDLERITQKVRRKQGWDATRASQAEEHYRRYLALLLVYPGKQIAPPGSDADEIWHGHILDTAAYHQDCDRLFGSFLHHVPSYGTPREKLAMAQAREQTEALYERHFGGQTEGAAGHASAEVFCVCMAEPANQDITPEVAGCVPCFGRHPKEKEGVRGADGCIPCLTQRPGLKETASAETARALCFARLASDRKGTLDKAASKEMARNLCFAQLASGRKDALAVATR